MVTTSIDPMNVPMSNLPLHSQILPSITVEFSFADLAEHLRHTEGGEKLLEYARPVFETIRNTWPPGAVYRLMKVGWISEQEVELVSLETGAAVRLAMGWSGTFLQNAELVVAGGYTTGAELERLAGAASREQRYLESYVIEQVGLALLGKTGKEVNTRIERVALENEWGVGPLLSPGSVHGWALDDQPNLCALLPLSAIGVTCGPSGVLSPFNSLTFIIGIGHGYTEKTIGSPCEVCLNRETCNLNHI